MNKLPCILLVTAFLSACGGGGATAPEPPPMMPAAGRGAPQAPAAAPTAASPGTTSSAPAPDAATPPPTAPPQPGAPDEAEQAEVPSMLPQPEGDPVDAREQDALTQDAAAPAVADGGDPFALRGYDPAAPDAGQPAAARADPAAAAGNEALAQSARAPRKLYVSPQGADSNPGSAERPFRSLVRAARAVLPGTTVYVAPGRYAGGIRTAVSGTEGQRIAFVSSTKWGAQIVPPAVSPNKTAWDNRGDRVDIIGFDIDGAKRQGGVMWTHGIYSGGSYDSIRHNRVRRIGQQLACNGAGGAAIGVDSYYGGVQATVVGNLVADIGPAGCRFVHGIYVSTTAQVKNNVVYRVSGGAIHLWHDARQVIITNNTVSTSGTGIIVGGGNFYRSSAGNDFTAVYSNIVIGNQMGISEQGSTGRNNTYRNNLVYQNARYDFRLKNGLKPSGTVHAAPRFRSSARGSEPSLRPAPDSPAVGRGLAQHADRTDFDGRPRNQEAGFDIGAYQH